MEKTSKVSHVALDISRLRELGIKVSERELQVFRALVQGQSNRQIARALTIAEGTVKQHVKNILQRNKFDNRYETYGFADVLGVEGGIRRQTLLALVRSCSNVDVDTLSDAEVRVRYRALMRGVLRIGKGDDGLKDKSTAA